MKYIRNFNDHSIYNNVINDDYLNINKKVVSYCKNERHIHIDQYIDPYNGHDYVEIGGIKWATMNVGATGVTDYGLYFQWGDTQGYTAAQVGNGEGQKYFGENDCIYYNNDSYTKYNSGDTKTVLDISDDAVRANWGGSWRMPTKDEYVALGEAVTSAWTADYQGSGVAGIICTDKTDSSKVLFFPACGRALYGSVNNVAGIGHCWSSSLNADYGGSNSYYLIFNSGNVHWNSYNGRCLGCPVRGVVNE